MTRSTTWYVTASTIASRAEVASVIVRLMMSINDLSLANNSIGDWSETKDRKKINRKTAATLYYVRILMGHLYEALKMTKFIAKDARLREMVMSCDRHTIEEFLSVERFIESEEMDILEDFRNRAAFHYDRELPIKNLKRLTKQRPDDENSGESDVQYGCSMGHDGLDWHFELGDMVMGSMLIRDVFKQDYPRSEERRRKVEEIASRQQEIARAFTDFAGHFIRHYSR